MRTDRNADLRVFHKNYSPEVKCSSCKIKLVMFKDQIFFIGTKEVCLNCYNKTNN